MMMMMMMMMMVMMMMMASKESKIWQQKAKLIHSSEYHKMFSSNLQRQGSEKAGEIVHQK